MASFKVADVHPEKVANIPTVLSLENLKKFESLSEVGCSEILQSSLEDKQSNVRICHKNGLMETIMDCYNTHHNLVLRPDDIWTAIMTQFSFYVNKHAERFRKQFVNFEGKKVLTIDMPGGPDFALFSKLMSKKIDENLVDAEVKKWILPSFSTTTDVDLVSCGIVFMATMKNYFKYRMMCLCGIPNVTLEGTVEDWKDILQRVNKLEEYGLSKWSTRLKNVLHEFVQAKKGNVDQEFWRNICHVDYKSIGSGGERASYWSGWIITFCAFDVEGNELSDEKIDGYHIPSGIVHAFVKVNDNGHIFRTRMIAGHLASEVMPDGCTIRPKIGWAVGLLPDGGNDDEESFKEDDPLDYC